VERQFATLKPQRRDPAPQSKRIEHALLPANPLRPVLQQTVRARPRAPTIADNVSSPGSILARPRGPKKANRARLACGQDREVASNKSCSAPARSLDRR
jgi:hypothetical protein